MSSKMIELGIDKLSVEEQRSLALEILDSLEDETAVDSVSDELWEELCRRDAEMDANPEIWMTWEEARSLIEAKLSNNV